MQTVESEAAVEQLHEKLSDPKVANALLRLLDRAEELDQTACQITEASKALPGMFAAGVDFADEACRNASQSDIDIEGRFKSLLALFLRISEPKNVDALSKLVSRLPQLEEASRLLDEAPNLVATLGDVFDDYARQALEDGVDLEKSVTHGLRAALLFGSKMDDQTVETISNAARALAVSQCEDCQAEGPQKVGPFGLLNAMSNPDVQKSLGFAIRFAKCFGSTLKER